MIEISMDKYYILMCIMYKVVQPRQERMPRDALFRWDRIVRVPQYIALGGETRKWFLF